MTDNPEKQRFVSDYLVIEIMTSLMACFTMISVEVMCLVYFIVEDMNYAHLCLGAIPCVAFVLIRRLRISQPLMLALHLLAGVVYVTGFYFIFLEGKGQAIGCTVFIGISVFALFMHSLTHRYSRKTRHVTFDNLVVLLSVHTVLLFIITIMGALDRNFYVLLDAIVIVGLHFAARQLDVFDTKYYHNLHSSTQPIKSMKSQNHYTIVLIFGGIGFALILLLFMPIETISTVVQVVIGAIFTFFGTIIGWFQKLLAPSAGEYNNQGAEMVHPDTEGYEPSDTAMIITVIIVVALALAFFFIFISTLRKLIKRFRVAEGTEKVVENNVVIDIIEDVPKKNKGLLSRHDFGEGYEGKIRKKYYHTVTRAMKNGITVKAATSPRQIEEQIKEKGDPSISELTSLYESVRYNKKDS
ncbi:MAG: hypothetical protein IK106_08700 [Clostridiales bacterium]|nr:hypothetical protein [Clostridiales bacterium]